MVESWSHIQWNVSQDSLRKVTTKSMMLKSTEKEYLESTLITTWSTWRMKVLNHSINNSLSGTLPLKRIVLHHAKHSTRNYMMPLERILKDQNKQRRKENNQHSLTNKKKSLKLAREVTEEIEDSMFKKESKELCKNSKKNLVHDQNYLWLINILY